MSPFLACILIRNECLLSWALQWLQALGVLMLCPYQKLLVAFFWKTKMAISVVLQVLIKISGIWATAGEDFLALVVKLFCRVERKTLLKPVCLDTEVAWTPKVLHLFFRGLSKITDSWLSQLCVTKFNRDFLFHTAAEDETIISPRFSLDLEAPCGITQSCVLWGFKTSSSGFEWAQDGLVACYLMWLAPGNTSGHPELMDVIPSLYSTSVNNFSIFKCYLNEIWLLVIAPHEITWRACACRRNLSALDKGITGLPMDGRMGRCFHQPGAGRGWRTLWGDFEDFPEVSPGNHAAEIKHSLSHYQHPEQHAFYLILKKLIILGGYRKTLLCKL